MSAQLQRVTIERQADGRWLLTRERDGDGERFSCDDLLDAFEIVSAAYRPDGTPRRWPGSTVLCSEGLTSKGIGQEGKVWT